MLTRNGRNQIGVTKGHETPKNWYPPTRKTLKQTGVDVHMITKIASNKSLGCKQTTNQNSKSPSFQKKKHVTSLVTLVLLLDFVCHLDFFGHPKKSPGPQVCTKKQG